MNRNLESFLDGYSKAISLFPNFETNNIQEDWEFIGLDIEISIKIYHKKKNMDKEWIKKEKIPSTLVNSQY